MGTTDDQRALLDCLPRDGGTISNRAVQERLGWATDHYWTVRDALVDAGLVVRGRGRGGTVRRYIESDDADKVMAVSVAVGAGSARAVEEVIENELALYEPMQRVIAGDWAKDHRSDPLAVEVTALQGRRDTGGVWSRPDIVTVEVRTFAYVPGKHLELTTFEGSWEPLSACNPCSKHSPIAALPPGHTCLHTFHHNKHPGWTASSLM